MIKSEEMKRFKADMASDKELNEKFNKTVDRIAAEKTAQSDGEIFAKAAQELGYNITAADFERLDAEREEVSSDELEKVAGGYYDAENMCSKDYFCKCIYHDDTRAEDEHGHSTWCITAWHCATATVHTESESQKDYCWKDYNCFVINK